MSLALWKLKGKREYLEQTERTLFNEFFANQFARGDFGHYKIADSGIDFGGARAWWCCALHGLRAFADIFGAVFRVEADRLYFDLPIDGTGRAGEFAIRADSNLVKDGSVTLEVVSAPTTAAELAVRVSGWSDDVTMESGDSHIEREMRDGYRLARRIWKTGARVTLRYQPKIRLERDARHSKKVGVFNGPWLLAVSEADSPYFFDEHYEHNRVDTRRLRRSTP